MTRRRQALGREGEAEAARYLEARGYRIVARNVRAARVEIDLVAIDAHRLVFVEVKTRRAGGSAGFGSHAAAAEAVDGRKQSRLRRGAMAWLDTAPELRRATRGIRFDVITCLFDDSAPPGAPPPEARARNKATARPRAPRWSIEHWRSAF